MSLLAFLLAAVCSIWLAIAPPAAANPVQSDRATVHLVSETESLQPGEPFWVGWHFQMRDGWHVYWRNPGDSGAAPAIAWRLPDGFEAGAIAWPHPERLPFGPLMNFGYEDEVTFLVPITAPEAIATGTEVTLDADADWLICKDECIPESGSFTLDIPVSDATPAENSQWSEAFDRARESWPQPSPWAVQATLDGERLALRIDAPELQANAIASAAFFPDEDGLITNAAPQEVRFDSEGMVLQLQRGYLGDVDRVGGVLTLTESLPDGEITRAFAIETAIAVVASAAPAEPEPSPATAARAVPLWQVLLLAFGGGVALNLMPCVFPVLSLKAIGIIQKTQKSAREVRWQSLAFAAGVLASFLAIAGVLLGLRALGQQIGWGFQLQSPTFVTLMAYLTFAVGLSLSGVFMVGASLMGIGQGLTARSGYAGEFFTGAFATVVATPCTAPFMATAIGVALAQPAPIALLVFTLLGIGMALPYVAIGFSPGLQKRLPKPGAWMETFQQLLAFPMYAATAWLLWVLAQQTEAGGLAAAFSGLVAIAFAAWLYQKTRLTRQVWQRLGTATAGITLGIALSLAQLPGAAPTSSPVAQNQSASGLAWQAYTVDRVSELRQSGRPVFVNFSASWCISCLVNERVALNKEETIAAFASENVALLKGDWTNRDPEITKALEAFGRSGVPFYALYPKDAVREPIVLPQILTPGKVIEAIAQL